MGNAQVTDLTNFSGLPPLQISCYDEKSICFNLAWRNVYSSPGCSSNDTGDNFHGSRSSGST
jgi:hypothetical protein